MLSSRKFRLTLMPHTVIFGTIESENIGLVITDHSIFFQVHTLWIFYSVCHLKHLNPPQYSLKRPQTVQHNTHCSLSCKMISLPWNSSAAPCHSTQQPFQLEQLAMTMENQVSIPSTPDVSHPLKSIQPKGEVHLIPRCPTGQTAKCQMAKPSTNSA